MHQLNVCIVRTQLSLQAIKHEYILASHKQLYAVGSYLGINI